MPEWPFAEPVRPVFALQCFKQIRAREGVITFDKGPLRHIPAQLCSYPSRATDQDVI